MANITLAQQPIAGQDMVATMQSLQTRPKNPPPSSSDSATFSDAVNVTEGNPYRKRVQGRIIALSHASTSVKRYLLSGRAREVNTGSSVVVSFPSMPEVVELARQVQYLVSPV